MTHFHATALRNRMRVSVHHHSILCPIPSGAEFESIEAALSVFGLYQIHWNPEHDAVRYSFYMTLFSGTYRTGYEFHADISLRDYRGRFINPDIVLQVVDRLLEARRMTSRSCRLRLSGFRSENFRLCPVPFTGRGYRSRIRRHVRTTAERREAAWIAFDEDVSEVGIRVRAKRSFCNLPDYRDDFYRSDRKNHGWKSNRMNQWRDTR